VHEDAFAGEKVPVPQVWHEVSPEAAYVPAKHSTQLPPATDELPARQLEQFDPETELVPAGQFWHGCPPVEFLLAGQFVQSLTSSEPVPVA